MSKNLLKRTLSAVLLIMVVSAGSYYFGFQHGLDQTKNIVVENVTNLDSPDNVNVDFNLFWEVWNKLKTEHIKGGEISDQDLLYGAIKGLTGALGDPNTVFFTPDDSKRFHEDISGNFS